MIIGHLSAAYLVAKGAGALRSAPLPTTLFAGFLIGGIAPDMDMLWFHLVDHGSTHHHDYLTHRPAIWAALGALGLLGARWAAGSLALALSLGALFHLMLDSIAGKIAWAWPFSDKAVPLVVVPAAYDNWILSFLLHWTFAVELAITAAAIIVLLTSRKNKKPGA